MSGIASGFGVGVIRIMSAGALSAGSCSLSSTTFV